LTVTRERVIALLVALAALVSVMAWQAPPAFAHDGVGGTTGHINVGSYSVNGNDYVMYAHLAGGYTPAAGSGDHHEVRGRVHFHTRRNGAVWDGGRIQVNVCAQRKISGGVWQTQGSTCNQHGSYPSATDWFADSATLLSHLGLSGDGESMANWRALITETAVIRFRRAAEDGGGSVLIDMASAVSNPLNT
jgi:hypothetical protein